MTRMTRWWISKPNHAVPVALFCAVILSLNSLVFAQDAVSPSPLPANLPDNILPGAVDKPIQQEFEQKADPAKLEQDKPVGVEIDKGGAEASAQLPAFTLSEIQMQTVYLLSREELEPIIRPWIGQTVTEKELQGVAKQITDLYIQKGYRTSYASLPPQKIKDGVVVMICRENQVANLVVKGNKHYKTQWVLEQLTNTQPGKPLNINELQADLMRIRKKYPRIKAIHADVSIRKLEKLYDPLLTDLTLVVEEQSPMTLNTSMDNTGRETIGNIRYNTTLVHQDFLNLGHTLVLSYTGASGVHSFYTQYQVPLNDWGWHVGVKGSLGKTLIGGEFDFLDLTGRSDTISVYTGIPLIKGQTFGLGANLSYNAKVSNTFIDDFRLDILEQNIRSVTWGLDAIKVDKWGRWTANGAMEIAAGEFTQFVKHTASLNRTLNLPFGMMMLLKTQGQYSPDNLPGMEQFQIGGFSTIRGYQEGMLMADSGILWGGELHAPFWGFPKLLKKNFEWLAFAEGGNTTLSDKASFTTKGSPGTLWSYGVGLRGRISKFLSGRIDVGFAQRLDTDEPTGRVHFGLTGTPF